MTFAFFFNIQFAVLNSKFTILPARLEKEMLQAAKNLEFARASELRVQLKSLS